MSNSIETHAHRPKRVALFTGNYNHIADGVSLTLNRLVRYLESKGSKVLVVGPTIPDPPLNPEGYFVPVPSVPMPNRHEYRIALPVSPSVIKEVKRFKPQLIHIATPDLLGQMALRFAKRRGLPVVSSYHTHFSSYLKYYGMDMLEHRLWRMLKKFYDQCRHVYVPSASMADVLREHGIDRNLLIWERGVETDRFNPEKRSEDWREQYGIKPDEVVVSFVSRLVWEKSLDVFVSVIRKLEAEGVPHRSLIVGDGPAGEDLKEQLPNTVFTGYQKGDDLARAYASSDVFLFPSETETFGNVTLEAMASKVPTVCADATGSKGLVVDGQTGFLVPNRNLTLFYEVTKRLVEDTNLRKQMGQAAYERALLFEWDKILAKIDHYYDLVLFPES